MQGLDTKINVNDLKQLTGSYCVAFGALLLLQMRNPEGLTH